MIRSGKGLTVDDIRKLSPSAKISEPVGTTNPKRWSNAAPNTIDCQHFPSKVEARVYLLLCGMFGKSNIRRQVTMPLVAGAGNAQLKPLRMTVDFAVMDGVKVKFWVDAKTKRKSREWLRGVSLFSATWGEIVEWDGLGNVPEQLVKLRAAEGL